MAKLHRTVCTELNVKYFFLRFSGETPAYPRTPNTKVGGTRNGIHSGMGQNILPVSDLGLPEMLINNLFWCWFCSNIYRY